MRTPMLKTWNTSPIFSTITKFSKRLSKFQFFWFFEVTIFWKKSREDEFFCRKNDLICQERAELSKTLFMSNRFLLLKTEIVKEYLEVWREGWLQDYSALTVSYLTALPQDIPFMWDFYLSSDDCARQGQNQKIKLLRKKVRFDKISKQNNNCHQSQRLNAKGKV